MGLTDSLNLRIGDRDSQAVGTIRDGAAVGRSRSPVSDVGGGDRDRSREAGVVVRLSPHARKILGETDAGRTDDAKRDEGGSNDGEAPAPGPKKLSNEDKQAVSRLAARDTEVHAHEAAHQAAARGLGGAASFSYEVGPDGRRYAVGGEVPVSIEPGRTPQETISNAQTVRAAALAPSDPSAQDLAVASQASQMEAQARQEVAQTKADGGDDKDQLMMFSALKAERGGGGGHAHGGGSDGGGGCALCRQAVSRYAQA
jgi:hypothetical protein